MRQLRGDRHPKPLVLPVLLTLAVVLSGMAYSIWWPAVVRHQGWYWAQPQDFWATYRDAHLVGWGYLSAVYENATGLVTLPGYPILLAPIAMLTSTLGLVEAAPQVVILKPGAWLIAGPYALMTAGVALAGFDSLVRRLGISRTRRRLFLVAETVAIWPALAIWGHPEDILAIGLVAFVLAAAIDGAWTRCGWLLGGAIAVQLLAVLVVPVVLAAAGRRRAVPILMRASVLPGFLLVAVLVPDFHDAWRALTQQPNYSTINHPTPWMLLSPTMRPHVVAAGPGRIVGLVVALLCGLLAIKWKHDPGRLVWLVATALAARCMFEAVIAPYYVMPAVALALVVGVRSSRIHWLLACGAGFIVTVVTHFHADMWVYWLEMAIPLFALMAITWPGTRSALREVSADDMELESGLRMSGPAALARLS